MKYSMCGLVITQKTSRTMKIAREHTHTHTRSHSTGDGHQPAWTKSENGPLLVSSLQPGLTTTNSKLPISCCSANDFDLNRVSLCSLSYFSFFSRLMCSLLRQVYYVSGQRLCLLCLVGKWVRENTSFANASLAYTFLFS